MSAQSLADRVRPRRGLGEDSIYKDGDHWRGAVSLGYGPDGKRVRKKVSGQTREEVAKKLRQLRDQLDAGLPVPDDRISVGGFLDRWLSVNLPGHVAPSNAGRLRRHRPAASTSGAESQEVDQAGGVGL